MVKLTPNEFTERARRVHKNKYDYSKFVYVDSKTKGIIVCHIHGKFLQTPNDHLGGHGCSLCGHDEVGKVKRSTITDFVRKADGIHEHKYKYSIVKYVNAYKKIIIICPSHGEFSQSPHNHLCGKGCPKCCSSKGEAKIQSWLRKNKVDYVYQKTFSICRNPKTNYKLKFDFYIPSKNLLIEYDGQQHFSTGYIGGNYFTTQKDLDELNYRDGIKTKFAKHSGISLLRISYKKLGDVENILSSVL